MDPCHKSTLFEGFKSDMLGFNKEKNSQVIPSIELPDDLFEESLDPWRFSLIGRLNLHQLKFIDDAILLRRQWKLTGDCKIIPLGRGFFTIKLDNEIDRQYIKEGKCEVLNQVLQILFKICKEIGTPIKLDEATAKCEVGYYANVLVEIDFAKIVPNKVWIGTKYGGFLQNISIPVCPKFCHNCKIVGHNNVECRIDKNKNQQVNNTQNNMSSATNNVQQQTPKAGKTQTPFDICDRSEVYKFGDSAGERQCSTSSVINTQVLDEDVVISNIVTPINASSNSIPVNISSGRFNILNQDEIEQEEDISVDEEIIAE
ncbi:uncharacterized protein LOC113290690 [Papaver somniferum]|uniref:uncharacterized protein LOC113290690 n=1 Tax=Papaver somniferum TaxID=3469 RepID=UPI000E7007B6|nr:uncharacterized protein LOC113290690 [Papaver somniferum]